MYKEKEKHGRPEKSIYIILLMCAFQVHNCIHYSYISTCIRYPVPFYSQFDLAALFLFYILNKYTFEQERHLVVLLLTQVFLDLCCTHCYQLDQSFCTMPLHCCLYCPENFAFPLVCTKTL